MSKHSCNGLEDCVLDVRILLFSLDILTKPSTVIKCVSEQIKHTLLCKALGTTVIIENVDRVEM